MMEDYVFDLEGVSFSFNKGRQNEVSALQNIDLKIKRGSIVVIKGVSGSGKTTLLNILDLLLLPQKGTFTILGENVSSLSEFKLASMRANQIGYIFQDFALINKEKVKSNLELPLLFSDKYKTWPAKKSRIDEVLLKLGIADKKKERVYSLSGGQRQRVAIARAIINDPEIILADEPTSALDKSNKAKIIDIFKELNKEGKTIIIVTHDSEVAGAFEKTYFLDGGVLSEKGASK